MICMKIVNGYWMRLSKLLYFVSGEQINYSTLANNNLRDTDESWYFAITKFDNIVLSFSHQACFLITFFWKLPFPRKSDHKKRKSVVSFTQLDNVAHEQTIICRHLIAGHVVGSQPMRRKKNLRQMIIRFSSHPRANVRHKGPLSSASAGPGIMYSNTSCCLTWDSLRKQLTFCDATAGFLWEDIWGTNSKIPLRSCVTS